MSKRGDPKKKAGIGVRIKQFFRRKKIRKRKSAKAKSASKPNSKLHFKGLKLNLGIDFSWLRRILGFRIKLNFKKIAMFLFGVLFMLSVVMAGITFVKFQRLDFWSKEEKQLEMVGKNMSLLMLGIDDSKEGLEFVDFIEVLYTQRDQSDKKMSIIAVDPEISVTITTNNDVTFANSQDAKQIYKFKQLLNFFIQNNKINYPEKSLSEIRELSLKEFIFEIEDELGVHIERYLLLRRSNLQTFENIFGEVSWQGMVEIDQKLEYQGKMMSRFVRMASNPLVAVRYLGCLWDDERSRDLISTDLLFKEAWDLILFFRELSEYSINTYKTDESEMYIKEGHKFLDLQIFDKSIAEIFLKKEILIEQARIDIVNGSGRNGLAGKYRRLLANYGFNVVRVANSTEDYGQNTLYVMNRSKDYEMTIEQLKVFFPDLEVVNKPYPHRPTGDIVLVVI